MHSPNENCDCDNTEGLENELTVTLTLDNNQELECVVLTIFPIKEQKYIALLPISENEEEEGEVYLYRFFESEDHELSLENIEDDEEYEAVADAFEEYLDAQEFDEMMEEEE